MTDYQKSLEIVKLAFMDSGISVSEWARQNGFSASLVYQILEGNRRCIRGQSHQIAVALGLKQGSITSVFELNNQLNPNGKRGIEMQGEYMK